MQALASQHPAVRRRLYRGGLAATRRSKSPIGGRP